MVARKIVAALIVLFVIAVGTVSADPLRSNAGFGDSKIFDASYKSDRNPSELSDGYIVITEGKTLVLENADIRVEIKSHSLVQIVSLGADPEFYLLDGRAEFSSQTGFTVRTTVTSYKAEASTTIFVITEDSEETAFVESKSAVATNLITGKVTTIVAGNFIDNARNGSAPEEKSLQEYWAETIAEEPETEAPAEVTVEIPVEATVMAEAAPEPEPVVYSRTISYNGFSVSMEATAGEACITYPSFVTDEEVTGAFAAVAAAYPDFARSITFSFGKQGTVYVYYPESYGEPEFELAAAVLEKELPVYIDGLLAYYAALEQETQKQAAEEQAEANLQPLVKEFIYRGFDAAVTAYVGTGYVTYPVYVSDEELGSCAAALLMMYPEDFGEIRYSVLRPGLAEISYPETYGIDEFNRLTGIVEAELFAYIDSVWVKEEPAKEETAETPVVVAEVQPEPEKTPIETTPRPEEPEEEPVEEEKTGFRFGMEVGVIYGFGNGDEDDDPDTFSAISFLGKRIGIFRKNALAIVNPYISNGNFKFGLHFTFGLKDGKFVSPISFDTKHGLTGYVGSAMHYISVLSYSTENGMLRIAAERNTALDFRSPVFEPFTIGYEKNDKLQLTASFQAGGFEFKAFVEDLEFRNKLNGRSDYAGARASYSFKSFSIGVSALADLKAGLRNMTFYPAADITVPLQFDGLKLEISAQGAVQFASNEIQAVLAKAYVDTITKDWLILGLGVAYNYKAHINEIMNYGPVDVVEQFKGNSLDLTLRAGVEVGPLSLIGKMTIPFSFNGGSTLAYNTVRTKYDKTENITVDTMDIRMQLTLGKFQFNAGVVYNGFAGKAANLVKAILNWSGKKDALFELVNPELSTYYANATFTTEIGTMTFSAFVRADLMRVNSLLVMPLSAGIGFTF